MKRTLLIPLPLAVTLILAAVLALTFSRATAQQQNGVASLPLQAQLGRVYYPANTNGGGCIGVSDVGPIVKKFVNVEQTASTSTTYTVITPLAANAYTHICGITIGANAAVKLTLEYGTNSGCSSGTTVTWVGWISSSSSLNQGEGTDSVLDTPAGDYTCWIVGATGLATADLNLIYAQY